jgi:hypothetical protein
MHSTRQYSDNQAYLLHPALAFEEISENEGAEAAEKCLVRLVKSASEIWQWVLSTTSLIYFVSSLSRTGVLQQLVFLC